MRFSVLLVFVNKSWPYGSEKMDNPQLLGEVPGPGMIPSLQSKHTRKARGSTVVSSGELRTKIITGMISSWISHPGKSPRSWRECSFQISHKAPFGRKGKQNPWMENPH
jgi:hypothetical protein